jgi:hypothetical protein
MERIRAERTRAVEDPSWESLKPMFVNLIAEERNRIPEVFEMPHVRHWPHFVDPDGFNQASLRFMLR